MGDIKIQSDMVKTKTAGIRKRIKHNILRDNQSKIKKMRKNLEISKAGTVTALKNQLLKEEKLVNGMGDLLTDLLDYVDMACNEFDKLDQSYAKEKIEG